MGIWMGYRFYGLKYTDLTWIFFYTIFFLCASCSFSNFVLWMSNIKCSCLIMLPSIQQVQALQYDYTNDKHIYIIKIFVYRRQNDTNDEENENCREKKKCCNRLDWISCCEYLFAVCWFLTFGIKWCAFVQTPLSIHRIYISFELKRSTHVHFLLFATKNTKLSRWMNNNEKKK